MKRFIGKPVIATVGALMIAAFAFGPTLAQVGMQFDPGNDAFDRTWSRTDLPVREGEADRTWMWGDGAFTEVMQEEYADSPGGMRDVQYYDKSRMEINDPDAVDDGLWYVTNGLLVVEMVDGRMQVGDDEFEDREAANQPIAGDPGAAYGPTYADINDLGLRGQPAVNEGEVLTQTITDEGDIVEDESFAEYGAVAGQRVSVPGIDHTVAQPFWDFMNSSGTVYENGEYVVDDLFLNAYYATGYPITEAYWATVPVGGTDRDVLWQCFERRCMTFTPGNPEGFVVEAGNVGQHYYNWRYEEEPEPEPETTNYDVLFGSLNGSGVDATGSMTLEGDQLTVMIDASGLTPDETHMQHIHGVDVEMSVCPTTDLDVDEDGIISFEEGFPAYGGVAVPLFEDAEGEFYPAADADGNVSFEQTFTVDEGLDLEAHTIIIHGMTVDAGDDETGYDASLPVACGQIYEEGNVPEANEFTYDLDEMNDSGASATADLSLTGQVLTVNIEASGLEAGALHPQHIHGLEGEMATCPVPEEADTNEDGFVEFSEGAPYYGGVVVNLAPYPTAEEDGTESFSLSYIVDDETIALNDRVMVIHGMTANIEGDEIDEDSYLASLPVACGGVESEEPEPEPEPEVSEFAVLFGELNGSDVSGSGSLTLADGSLNVMIETTGMTPDEMHMQHIHGVDVDMAVCPGPELDVNEDGIVDIGEGGPAYGGVAVPLFEDIEAEEYPVADESGNVTFSNDFEFDGTAEDLTNHVIVLHGAPVDEEYDATVPVACGLIVPAEAQSYVAGDLSGDNEAPDPVVSDGGGEAWFWHDHEAENDVVYFMLTVNDLEDVTAAHIHQGVEGEAGGVVVGLFTPAEGSFPVDGILASGRITADNLSGDLEGMTIDDLVALFGSGENESDAYVNVHTETNPGGEIRGQVVALLQVIE